MKLSQKLYAQLVAHAEAEAPNECCGLIGTREAAPASYYPIRNEFESPKRFHFHTGDLQAVYEEGEGRGEALSIVYHSHPRTEAYPSQTDINIANEMKDWFPERLWVITSLAATEPVVRAFRIGERAVEEVELVVE